MSYELRVASFEKHARNLFLATGNSKPATHCQILRANRSADVRRINKHFDRGPTATGNAAMLVLSRTRDESIIIGDNVVVTVVDIRGDKVKLGIEAPQDVTVHRREVYEAIRRENQQAAKLRPEETRGLGQSSTSERP